MISMTEKGLRREFKQIKRTLEQGSLQDQMMRKVAQARIQNRLNKAIKIKENQTKTVRFVRST